jgi:hypothetical protein
MSAQNGATTLFDYQEVSLILRGAGSELSGDRTWGGDSSGGGEGGGGGGGITGGSAAATRRWWQRFAEALVAMPRQTDSSYYI